MGLNPEATFDSLFIGDRLLREAGTVAASDFHLFAYLACLLWLYNHMPVSEWGYEFVGTELGAPYSQDIDEALRLLTERGYFVTVEERFSIAATGLVALHDLSVLSVNQERTECLRAACASTAALSMGMVGNALSEEPELHRARTIPMSRRLLERSGQDQLYLQFEALRGALQGGGGDLRVPAVVWLQALYRSAE